MRVHLTEMTHKDQRITYVNMCQRSQGALHIVAW